MYVAIASDELLLAFAAVDVGYASNAFAFAFDARSQKLLANDTSLGPPLAACVSEGPDRSASYRMLGANVHISERPGSRAIAVDLRMRGIEIQAELDARGAPPPISAIGAVPGGVANMTEKRALMAVKGEAVIAGRRVALRDAVAGYDYTNGLLARHTQWRWAFALGRAKSGERIAFNLVEGFVGESECAAWVDGELYPLAEGRFVFNPKEPLSPWGVCTADGGVDLTFRPGGAHTENRDYVALVSHFVQVAGTYSGKIAIEGKGELELSDVLGVTEDQDMLW